MFGATCASILTFIVDTLVCNIGLCLGSQHKDNRKLRRINEKMVGLKIGYSNSTCEPNALILKNTILECHLRIIVKLNMVQASQVHKNINKQ